MSEKKLLRELRVAGILDELSCFCFPYDCKYLNLTYENWKKELEEFQPELLFVESAWHGVNNKWYKRIYNLDPAFTGIIDWCRVRGIPTVFWNKEDPVHFDTFLGAAACFDWVYTTDMDCVPLYKRMLGHNNVGVLPFAVETALFTPVEKYERKTGCCFAGGYYAKQEERCKDFNEIVDLFSSKMPFTIYDRNVYPGNPDYAFPDKYKDMILGSLPMNKIDVAYKGYDWSLTMNTVKGSSTMEARRIFELLACNTLSVSNPCVGIKNLLGDLVLQNMNDTEEFNRRATDVMYSDRVRLLGLRKVLSQHTYYHRMVSVCKNAMGTDYSEPEMSVCCFSTAKTLEDTQRIINQFRRFDYKNKMLVIASPHMCAVDDNITFVKNINVNSVSELANADYYCYLSPKNYYGTQYISDFMLTRRYSSASVFGKGAYYKWSDGSFTAVDKSNAYIVTDRVLADRCIFTKIAAAVLPMSIFTDNKLIEGFVTMSTDMFHFCEGFKGEYCEDVEDIDIDCGVDMDYLWNYALNLPAADNHYSMPFRMSGAELSAQFSKNPTVYNTIQFNNGVVGLYSLVNDYKNVYVKLSDDFAVDDFNIDGWTRIFVGGYGYNTKIVIHFKDENGKNLRTVPILAGQYLRCPIMENFKYFSIYAIITNKSVLAVNELIINAFPGANLKIAQLAQEDENE